MATMDSVAIEALLDEVDAQVTREKQEKLDREKRSSTEVSERSKGSRTSRRRSRSPRRERERERDTYRRRDDRDRDHYRPRDGRRRSVSADDNYYRPGRRDERERGGERPERRDRDRDQRDRDREREPRKDRRDRDQDRDRNRGDRDERLGDTRRKDHGRKTKTPELNDDERDSRTVFVQQLAARLRTKDLGQFFSSCGPVKEAQIVKDRVSGRSKGVGYVEFKEEESVQRALQLTGQKLLGIPVIVQLTEAEKNRQARTTEGGTNPQNSGIPFHRLYVGNIHFSITEDDLTNVFEPFGELEFVQLQKEEQGRSKGYGFVQYRDPAAAKEALEKMNGFDLAGRPIRVGLGNDKFTSESTQNLLQRFPQQGSSVFGAGGRGTHAGGEVSYESKGRREDRGGIGNASALNDTDVGESNLANISRHDIMRKLMRADEPSSTSNGAASEKAKPVKMAPPPPKAPQASRCIVLSNVYDLAEEESRGGDWKSDLLLDIKQECERKFGTVVHIDTDPNTSEVYVKFGSIESGGKAVQGLNGRHFGGRMIAAAPIIEAVYNSHWSRAINL